MEAIVKTDFNFPGQTGHYVGKVRDVYSINDEYLVMVVSDRISAFDVVLPEGIPFKGQVLNQIAAKFLDATTDILPFIRICFMQISLRSLSEEAYRTHSGSKGGRRSRLRKAGQADSCRNILQWKKVDKGRQGNTFLRMDTVCVTAGHADKRRDGQDAQKVHQ